MDLKRRKLISMRNALHLKDGIDRFFVSSKEGGSKHVIFEDSRIQGLHEEE